MKKKKKLNGLQLAIICQCLLLTLEVFLYFFVFAILLLIPSMSRHQHRELPHFSSHLSEAAVKSFTHSFFCQNEIVNQKSGASRAVLNWVFSRVCGGRGTPGFCGRICLLECIQSLQVPFNTGPGLVYC